MENSNYTYEQLKSIDESVDDRKGWDFSRMKTEREPVPWDYLEIVPRYLKQADTVLDVGTGGGEKFLFFSQYFERGVGIDPEPEMIRTARQNGAEQSRVTFLEMGAESLEFPDASFDVVLTRHAPVFVPKVVRVLKPGGYFIAQQVGAENMDNIRQEFGTGSGVKYAAEHPGCIDELVGYGCRIVATGDYNVHYWVKDVPSLVFWLKAIAGANPVPEGFSIDRDWRTVRQIISKYWTSSGVLTNEHRNLLIAQKGSMAS